MKSNNSLVFAMFLTLMVFHLPVVAQAEQAAYETSSLFKFQQKLALKSNVRAQYKLASMYEVGEGTKKDLTKAVHWYDLAHKAGLKAAGDRIIYLTIKKQGYDQAKYASWLASVKVDAGANKGEAKFLMAQLYHEGIGVKKDLARSLQLFEQISLLGDANVDNEMAVLREEIDARNQTNKRAIKQAKWTPALAKPVPQPPAAQPPLIKKEQLALKLAAEKNKMVEKKKRYDAVMLKIKQEQKLIDDQQAEISGGGEVIEDEI